MFDTAFWVQIIIYAATLGTFAGAVITRLGMLEKKQDKYNNIQERMVKVESSAQSAHHRLDEFVQEHREHQVNVNNKLDEILKCVNNHVFDFHTK